MSMVSQPPTPRAGQYIEILTNEGNYAVPLDSVRELLRWEGATEIPRSTMAVRGAVNVRGQIVPIIDLRRALGLGDVDYGRRGVVVLLQNRERVVGLLVEAVGDVLELGEDDARLPPSGLVGEDEPIGALLRHGDHTAFLLDVAKLSHAWLPAMTKPRAGTSELDTEQRV